MPGRRAQENAIAVVLLLLFAAVFMMSLGYSPRARLVPLPIAALGMGLTIVQLVWQNLRSLDDLTVDMLEFVSGEQSGKAPAGTEASRADSTGRELRAFGIVGTLLALCLVFGPLPAVFIFLAGYFGWSRLCSWPMALTWAFAGTTALYILFGRLLGIQFNRGLLAPVFSPFLHF
jgi:hypothetical protein